MGDYYSYLCRQKEELAVKTALKKERAEKRKLLKKEKLIKSLAEKYDEFKKRNVSYDADLNFLKQCICIAYKIYENRDRSKL